MARNLEIIENEVIKIHKTYYIIVTKGENYGGRFIYEALHNH